MHLKSGAALLAVALPMAAAQRPEQQDIGGALLAAMAALNHHAWSRA